ncbi:signal transduction histidine kinase [Xenococcus sp. PCC 7305]|uniref:sensor histidine kinase n=1 Tax=Xenococcus sp. PCC 7305 TaxID=102125 RepID=UPI0002AC17C9|nr:HAMP domain-containing sensor histidine kinase [Xenococcus sp. PCC 7305]ELS03387.1 signal transduction histidine kinase [Xenococcus sp. PCC 7305]
MSNRSGLILQQGKQPSTASNINLLIVTDDFVETEEIIQTFNEMTVDIRYDTVFSHRFPPQLFKYDYDVIIYNYSLCPHTATMVSPLEKIEGWYRFPKQIPLILITETLGDEMAIECVQSGINGYILRHKLYKLPKILEKVLLSVDSEQGNQQPNPVVQLKKRLAILQTEKEQLQTAVANKEEYFSHLNHELRSPIAAILGFARMLKDEIYGSLNAKQMQYVSAALTTGEHLLDLVNDYLDIAKINANREELYCENLPVEDICQASLAIVEEKARAKELELVLNMAEDVDFCFADKLRLKQILVNLLTNAVKFTESGSVTLKVTSDQKMLNFAVIDTGIGISPEDSQNLFQPFQQVNNISNRRHKGTGLGLALSKKLAQLHGGDIVVTSKLGEGSCFCVSIPR